MMKYEFEVLSMGSVHEPRVGKGFFAGMFLVCVILGGVFAFVYFDLKADFAALKDDYENVSATLEQMQSILDALNLNQTAGLAAVQIYNLTKRSVVLITSTREDSIAEGSGFVYDAEGHIVTNNHVVEESISLTVTFQDGTVKEAQITGADVYTDLAVIKVADLPENVHPLIVADSSQLMVGEPVYAIGNPFRLSGSMTAGIVSQLGRVLRLSDLGVPPPMGNYSIVDVIQSDTAINPGNSGGPLLNAIGLVVGVTFAIETGGESSGFIGIGYAVPSVLVRRVVPAIIENGTYRHPWIGIEFRDMTLELAQDLHTNYTQGILISSVVSGGPASDAGLRKDDIIIGVDTATVNAGDDLLIYIERHKSPGDAITLTIVRDNATSEKSLTLGERPSS
jgi:S1-C subfamily serine protease